MKEEKEKTKKNQAKKTNTTKKSSSKTATKNSNKTSSAKKTQPKKNTTVKKDTPKTKKETKQPTQSAKETKKKSTVPAKTAKPKKASKQEIISPKEEIIEETVKPKIIDEPKEKIKNEKLVLLICALIIALLIFGIVYVVSTNYKEEKRLKQFAQETQAAAKTNVSDEEAIPGSVDYDNIEEITYEEYEAKLKNEKKMILLISSRSCTACARFQSIMSKVLVDKEITAYKIETTKLTEKDKKSLGEKYDIQSTPTTIIISNKKETAKLESLAETQQFIEWLDENYY